MEMLIHISEWRPSIHQKLKLDLQIKKNLIFNYVIFRRLFKKVEVRQSATSTSMKWSGATFNSFEQ